MLKKIALMSVVQMVSLVSLPVALPDVLDFSQFPATPNSREYPSLNPAEIWKWGAHAFNCASELVPLFSYLQREYELDAAIETGTLLGSSTLIFSMFFDQVHTIEIDPSIYISTKNRLKNFTHVECHLGSSDSVLNKILPSLKDKRLFFYLDAHVQGRYWPLLDELEAISKTHRDNCVIVIDDFQVPGRPDIAYDSYEKNACSFEFIAEKLNKVFSAYTMHYIIPKSVLSKAKFIAIPKAWSEQ